LDSSVLTGMCHACSDHETEGGNARAGRAVHHMTREGGGRLYQGAQPLCVQRGAQLGLVVWWINWRHVCARARGVFAGCCATLLLLYLTTRLAVPRHPDRHHVPALHLREWATAPGRGGGVLAFLVGAYWVAVGADPWARRPNRIPQSPEYADAPRRAGAHRCTPRCARDSPIGASQTGRCASVPVLPRASLMRWCVCPGRSCVQADARHQ
jgi:hypothetical protein